MQQITEKQSGYNTDASISTLFGSWPKKHKKTNKKITQDGIIKVLGRNDNLRIQINICKHNDVGYTVYNKYICILIYHMGKSRKPAERA